MTRHEDGLRDAVHELSGGHAMLVLSRKSGEQIMIGPNVAVRVVGIQGNCVRLGIVAPRHVPIHREEVFRRIQSEEEQARSEAGQFESEFHAEFA